MFGEFLCPSSGVFSLYTQQWYTSYRFADSLRAGSGPNCSQAVRKPVWHIPLLCVQWKTPDDGQRNSLTHIQFYSKNKFEKLMHIVGFITSTYHDARSPERQNFCNNLCLNTSIWTEAGRTHKWFHKHCFYYLFTYFDCLFWNLIKCCLRIQPAKNSVYFKCWEVGIILYSDKYSTLNINLYNEIKTCSLLHSHHVVF